LRLASELRLADRVRLGLTAPSGKPAGALGQQKEIPLPFAWAHPRPNGTAHIALLSRWTHTDTLPQARPDWFLAASRSFGLG